MSKPTDTDVHALMKPPEVLSVNPQQEVVILHLLCGKRQQEAAELAKVTPETVSRWLAQDAQFVAVLNMRRRELWQVQRDQLRTLVTEAIETVSDCMVHGKPETRLRAALAILQGAGVLEGAPDGPTDVDGVKRQWFDERRRNEISAIDLLTF